MTNRESSSVLSDDAIRIERILSEVERRFLQPIELPNIYSLVSEKAQELIGDCITATCMLDESAGTMRAAAYHGLDIPFERLVKTLGLNPLDRTIPLEEMTADEFRPYREVSLKKLDDGIYSLFTRHVPRNICTIVEELLRITGVYVIGFVKGKEHLGGLIILARSDIGPYMAALERLVRVATLVIGHKRVERSFKESEAGYRLLFDSAGVGVDCYSTEGDVISLNGVAAHHRSGKPGDFKGKSIFKLYAKEIATVLLIRIQQAAASDVPQEYEDEVKLSGGTKWFHSTFVRMVDSQARVKGVQVISLDVTRLKKAEDATYKNETKFTRIFKLSPEGITIASMKDGRFIDVNDAFLRKTGFSRDEVIGHTTTELGVWFDPVDRRKYIETLARDGGLKDYEMRHRVKDGSVRLTLVSSGMMEIDGELCSINYMLDITGRKLAEAALRESEEKYRNLVDNAKEAIIVAQDGILKFVNSATCELSGFSEAELMSRPFLDMVCPDDRERVRANYENRMKGCLTEENYNFRIITKGSSFKPVEHRPVLITWQGRPATLDFLSVAAER